MPTINELIEEKCRNQERISKVMEMLEKALTTMRLWAKEEGSNGKPRKKILEMAEIVLREHGKPLHVKDIAARILQKFDIEVIPQSLGTMLWRAVRAGRKQKAFVKEQGDNNTYGLKEWEK